MRGSRPCAGVRPLRPGVICGHRIAPRKPSAHGDSRTLERMRPRRLASLLELASLLPFVEIRGGLGRRASQSYINLDDVIFCHPTTRFAKRPRMSPSAKKICSRALNK